VEAASFLSGRDENDRELYFDTVDVDEETLDM
jgi:hypothetical protein